MTNFNELNKEELAQLNETQVEAYIDIELAGKNIVKPVNVEVNFPDFVKFAEVAPEKDIVIYEVDGYAFPELEMAQKFQSFVQSLPQVSTDYDWTIGSDFKYAKGTSFVNPSIAITRVYSEAKYGAIKEQLKHISEKKKEKTKLNDEKTDSVIDYNAIDEVKYAIRTKVREAIQFFATAEKIARDYAKYFAVTNDVNTAFSTLYTVYNIQDEELKGEIQNQVVKLEQQVSAS